MKNIGIVFTATMSVMSFSSTSFAQAAHAGVVDSTAEASAPPESNRGVLATYEFYKDDGEHTVGNPVFLLDPSEKLVGSQLIAKQVAQTFDKAQDSAPVKTAEDALTETAKYCDTLLTDTSSDTFSKQLLHRNYLLRFSDFKTANPYAAPSTVIATAGFSFPDVVASSEVGGGITSGPRGIQFGVQNPDGSGSSGFAQATVFDDETKLSDLQGLSDKQMAQKIVKGLQKINSQTRAFCDDAAAKRK